MSFSRRHFMHTVGAGGLALSCLKSQRALAQDKPFPKRFLVVFTPNGSMPDAWGADGTREDFTLRPILQDLTSFKDRLVIVEGLTSNDVVGPGDAHQRGMGTWLTGTELTTGIYKGGCDTCSPSGFADGVSLDQQIANVIGEGTRFRSLEAGVMVEDVENNWTRMITQRPGQALPPEDNPTQFFERVFADLSSDPSMAEERTRMRKSVLDYLYSDFNTVRGSLGTEGRQLLERHEDTLRDIESRLQNAGDIGATCRAPQLTEQLDPTFNDNAPAIGKLQMDMLVMALACDLTRVGSLQWNNSVGQMRFPWAGVTDRHHDLSHEGDGNGDARSKIIKINTWYAEQFAYLLNALDQVPEGDGTLLDNTLVIWGNELAVGNTHSRAGLPFVLAGSGGGSIRTGQYLKYTGRRYHNDLLLAIARSMGIEGDTFGMPKFNTGILSELLPT